MNCRFHIALFTLLLGAGVIGCAAPGRTTGDSCLANRLGSYGMTETPPNSDPGSAPMAVSPPVGSQGATVPASKLQAFETSSNGQ